MILPAIPSSVGMLVLTACLIASMGAAEPVVYRNTAPGIGYTGSSACAGCHPKIWRDYARTAMGRSIALATAPDQLANGTDTVSVFQRRN